MAAILWKCDACGRPAKWCFINGVAHYWCSRCSVQLELFEIVVGQPTLQPDGNFQTDLEYVQRERGYSGSRPSDEGLPF